MEKTIIFELMPWSWQHITVSFIHPYDENMTTAELDLTDIANLKCSVNSTLGDGHAAIIASEYPSKVLQRFVIFLLIFILEKICFNCHFALILNISP